MTHNFESGSSSESRKILLGMFSEAVGYEVTEDTELTVEEELTAGIAVVARLEAVSQEMKKISRGEQANMDVLMGDTEAQAAVLLMGMEAD